MPNTQFLPGRLLCMGLLALALAGCAGSGGARPRAAAANAASSADSLAQTAWELVRWVQPGGALRDIPHGDNGEPVKLVFLAQGKQYRVNGFAGCNRYMGTYRIEGGRLRIDAPAATRMAARRRSEPAWKRTTCAAWAASIPSRSTTAGHPVT